MEAGNGEVRLGQIMAMDPSGRQVELPGEHTGAVLHSLGLDKARIAALRAAGVAGGP